MLTTGERATAHRIAATISERGDLDNDDVRRLFATALLEAEERERGYRERIADLKDTVERVTASGVENATRYAADLDRERRAGAAAVESIRAALLEGASDEAQQWAAETAAIFTCDELAPSCAPTLYKMSRAYLALGASHAEARALLSDFGERAWVLLNKGGK
jgi:hypothetical protein